MIPGDPRDAAPIRAHTWIRDKIASVEQYLARAGGSLATESDQPWYRAHDRVLRLAPAGVIFPHTKQLAPASVELEIRVAIARPV